MKNLSASIRSFVAVAAAVGLLAVGVAGCGGSSSGDSAQEKSTEMQMVTVNWIEGLAMTYMQERILEDSLGMDVQVREVQGGGIAFSSVAGDADFFNEAWLPTTHKDPWNKNKDKLQKLGYTYRGTSAGMVVPAYMDIDDVSELGRFREELDGTLNGIESGANVNDQMRTIIENNDLEGFTVTAASGPANWQALESAINNKEPIVVAGWKPHWKWSEFDVKYLGGAQTGQTPVFGAPENIFTIVDNEFTSEFPKEVVCFLKEFEANDDQVGSLMFTFKDRGDMSKEEAVSQWIQNHPEHVNGWMKKARECAASDEMPQALPDDAGSKDESQSA
jgi:glycine betaine/proline transport system substrate-binding protein